MRSPNKSKGLVFAGLLAVFTLATFLITNSGVDDGPEHGARVFQITLGTITGPLTGAISRGFQDCCLSFSLSVMMYCGPVLALGFAAQILRLPDQRWARVLKMTLWTIGWLAWFGGGILSFGHALS